MTDATVRELLLARSEEDRTALKWREDGRIRTMTWREYVATAAGLAAAVRARLDPSRPPHVGVLLPNGPAFAIHLAAAALGGHVVVGLNSTRRGEALTADVRKADCQFVVDDATLPPPLPVEDVPAVSVPEPDDLFMLIFTSGTSGDPKAVRVTHRKVTQPGAYLVERLGLRADDCHYISMPLFHSNGVLAGWAPALSTGASFAAAPFSASGFLPDVRDFGASYAHYVGKPLAYILATPERADDHVNPLRLVFGNEAGDRDVTEFARRFDCRVVDGFGSTENAVVISRTEDTPLGSLGRPQPGVAVLDPATGLECPPAEFAPDGRVLNLDECVGELVNTSGPGQFAGYYNDESATAERMRDGMYWSGDLAYRDAEGWVYFAGRTADWLRVDGENLAAAPIERILVRHPAISEAAVHAVPDPRSGDQLAAVLVLRGELTPAELESFLADQPDLGTKQWPRLVRLVEVLPRTATNKVLKRELPHDGFTWARDERGRRYRWIDES